MIPVAARAKLPTGIGLGMMRGGGRFPVDGVL